MNKKTLFFAVIVGFALVFVAAVALYRSAQPEGAGESVGGSAEALQRAGAPVKGPLDARVVIVEFFDPACGTCSSFYPLVNALIDEYPGKVKVMMRYAPLHQGSDQVVKLLEAAHLQGKFWPALELLFANQAVWVENHKSQPARARAMLENLGLDQQQFSADLIGLKVAEAVKDDLLAVQTLPVRATPEFFVNGRPMPSFGEQQLRQLVAEAIAEAY